MHWRRRTLPGLLARMALIAALTLAGCAEQVEETIADDVNNRSFTFSDGAVFHPALAQTVVTLQFTNSSNLTGTFILESSAGMARGTARFRPCSLTVDPETTDPETDGSTYASFVTGPQGDDVLVLSICDFDLDARVLILGNGTIVVISSPAVDVRSNG